MAAPFDEDVRPHDHRGHVVIVVGAVMTALATFTVLARLYTRYFIINHIGVDDWMAIFSLVFAHAMNISQSINATGLLGSRFYDIKNFPVEFPEFLKLFWVNEIMYNFTMFFIKMTFLCQYYRIFSHMRAMRLTYLVAMVAIGGWCFAQVVAIVFTCIPPSDFWRLGDDNKKCQNQMVGVWVNAVGTLVTDIAILLLPLPALWKLKLPRTQKWALLGIFLIGGVTSAISIVRLTTLSGGGDFTYDTVNSAALSVTEICTGIIAASLATIRKLLSRFLPGFGTRFGKSSAYGPYGDYSRTAASSRHHAAPLATERTTVTVASRKGGGASSLSEEDLFHGYSHELRPIPSTGPHDPEADAAPAYPSAAVRGKTDDVVRVKRTKSGLETRVFGGFRASPESSPSGDEGGRAPCETGIRVERNFVVRESTAQL